MKDAGKQVLAAHHSKGGEGGEFAVITAGDTGEKIEGAGDISGTVREEAGTGPIALDIETLSLQGPITCVCIWGANGFGRSWVFRPDFFDEDFECGKREIVIALERASLIYAFAGLSFDIPMLARFLNVTELTGLWVRKLVDPLAQAKALFGTQACIKLDVWLGQNGFPQKISNGLLAVRMAEDGKWDDLVAYCMKDAELTYDVVEAARKGGVHWNHLIYSPWSCDKLFTL